MCQCVENKSRKCSHKMRKYFNSTHAIFSPVLYESLCRLRCDNRDAVCTFVCRPFLLEEKKEEERMREHLFSYFIISWDAKTFGSAERAHIYNQQRSLIRNTTVFFSHKLFNTHFLSLRTYYDCIDQPHGITFVSFSLSLSLFISLPCSLRVFHHSACVYHLRHTWTQ